MVAVPILTQPLIMAFMIYVEPNFFPNFLLLQLEPRAGADQKNARLRNTADLRSLPRQVEARAKKTIRSWTHIFDQNNYFYQFEYKQHKKFTACF